MKWKEPHIIKVYEALGAVADNRMKVEGNEARLYSSSGNKFYTISYDKNKNAVMCNDNASYYVGTLGYPVIAYLMKIGELSYSEAYAQALQGIKWKDLNMQYNSAPKGEVPKYDFDKVVEFVNQDLEKKGINIKDFKLFLTKVMQQIKDMQLEHLGDKIEPPKGY